MTQPPKNPLTHLFSAFSLFAFAGILCLTVGCEDASSTPNVSWNGTTPEPEIQEPAVADTSATADTSADAGSTLPGTIPGTVMNNSDAVDYRSLRYTFGGSPNGSGAALTSVQIAGLSIRGSSLAFRYVKDLSAWGLSSGQADAIACLFVQKASGEWVGGKFDWISSSRTTRDLENVFDGYVGWSLAGVPNPCNAAFVIISKDGKKRSNVIACSWSR